MPPDSKKPSIAVIGTVGVPARYGGFETLAENLARYRERNALDCELSVYCSGKAYAERRETFAGASLYYVGLEANGALSPLYDFISILAALRRGTRTILVLGVSGTLALPFLRALTRARYVVNVDGLEWKRAKWSWLSSRFLQLSEWAAAKFAHRVIADNRAIVEHLKSSYGIDADLIPYGGDHAATGGDRDEIASGAVDLPEAYALLLCRIEPENNIHLALEAFRDSELPLVAVGNWQASEYGRKLHSSYSGCRGVHLLDPIYDAERLLPLRSGASVYIHGHSAGGTNPSLVEMMWLERPVLAFDCNYNRHTTANSAHYFRDAAGLRSAISAIAASDWHANGARMGKLARERYSWEVIGRRYFDILLSEQARAGK